MTLPSSYKQDFLLNICNVLGSVCVCVLITIKVNRVISVLQSLASRLTRWYVQTRVNGTVREIPGLVYLIPNSLFDHVYWPVYNERERFKNIVFHCIAVYFNLCNRREIYLFFICYWFQCAELSASLFGHYVILCYILFIRYPITCRPTGFLCFLLLAGKTSTCGYSCFPVWFICI